MSDYIYNGVSYSQDDIESKAEGLGLTVEQYLNKYKEIKPVNAGKTTDSTPVDPNVESSDMGSTSEDGSLDSPKQFRYNHITTEQIDKQSGFFDGKNEDDMLKLIKNIYGDKFDIDIHGDRSDDRFLAGVGEDAILMTNKANGKKKVIRLDNINATGLLQGYFNEGNSSRIQKDIIDFVENSLEEDEKAEGDYSERKRIRDKTGGAIDTDQTISYIPQSSFIDRFRFDQRDGKFGFNPRGSFFSGGYNPDQVEAGTKALDKITSDISYWTRRHLSELDDAQFGPNYNVSQDTKAELHEKIFESLNDHSNGYLLPKDAFETLMGGEHQHMFIDGEIKKIAAKHEKEVALNKPSFTEEVHGPVKNDLFGGKNIKNEDGKHVGFYGTLPEVLQNKADLVAEKTPLETQLREVKEKMAKAKDSKELQNLKNIASGIEEKIADVDRRIDANADKNRFSNWLSGMSYEDLTSKFMKEGYTEERAKAIAWGIQNQKSDMDQKIEDLKSDHPNLTDRELLTKYLDGLVVDYQTIIKKGSETMITIDLSKMSSTDFDEELINHIKSGGGIITETLDGGFGEAEISLADAIKFGIDVRDFRGGFDDGVMGRGDAISEEDLFKLENYEAARDHNHGLMRGTWEMVALDRDPKDIDAGTNTRDNWMEKTVGFTQDIGIGGFKAIATQWFDVSERQADQMISGPISTYTNRKMLDNMQMAAIDFNDTNKEAIERGEVTPIMWSDEQVKALERTFMDNTAEQVGGFVPLLIELGGLTMVQNYALGAIKVADAAGKLVSAKKYLDGLRKSKNAWDNTRYHATMLALEEVKMQTAGFKPGSGAAFYGVGAFMRPWFRPGALSTQLKGLDPLFSKTAGVAVSGAIAGEFALVTELGLEHIAGERNWSSEMKYLFGDMDEVEQRIMTNAMVFGIAGQMGRGRIKTGLRGGIGDFHISARAKRNVRDKIKKKLQRQFWTKEERAEYDALEKKQKQLDKDKREGKITRREYKKESYKLKAEMDLYKELSRDYSDLAPKEQKRVDALRQAWFDAHNLFSAHANSAKLDPRKENKEFKKNVENLVAKPVNEIMRFLNKKNHKDFEIEYVGEGEMSLLNMKDPRNPAEFHPESNKIFINRDQLIQKFNSGRDFATSEMLNHELVHMALRQVFKNNIRMEPKFINRIDNVFRSAFGKPLKDIMGETVRGGSIKKFVDKNYKVEKKEGETKEQTKEREFDLKQEEYLSNLAEFMTNPEVYYSAVNNSFMKNAKMEVYKFLEELHPSIAKRFKPKTAHEFIEFLGRLGDSARKAEPIAGKVSQLAQLDDITFMGIEYKALSSKEVKAAKGVVDYGARKKELGEKNKELLLRVKAGKMTREKMLKEVGIINKELKEINKNIEISKQNEILTKEYKKLDKKFEKTENEVDKLKRDKVFEKLREQNEGILNDYINNTFREVPGSEVTKDMFAKYVRNTEFNKLLKTYNNRAESLKDVPFGAYLRDNIKWRTGNILRDLQKGKKEKFVSLQKLQEKGFDLADTGGGYKETPADLKTGDIGIELVSDLKNKENKSAVKPETIQEINSMMDKGQGPFKTWTYDVVKKLKNAITGKKEEVTVTNELDYFGLKDLTPGATKEMFGKTTQEKANFMANNVKTLKALMPKNLTETTGTKTGLENVLMTRKRADGNYKDVFYEDSGVDVAMKDTGAKTGTEIKNKRKLTDAEWLAEAGIKDNRTAEQKKDGTGDVDISAVTAKNEKGKPTTEARNILTSLWPAIINQTGKAITNQVVRSNPKFGELVRKAEVKGTVETIKNQIASGKSDALASKGLSIQPLSTQKQIYRNVQSKEFRRLLERYLKEGKRENAIGDALKAYYSNKDITLIELNRSTKTKNAILRKIGEELGKSLRLEGYSKEAVALRIGDVITGTKNVDAVNSRLGLSKLESPYTSEKNIEGGRVVTFKLAEFMDNLPGKGKGYAEQFIFQGVTTGSGIGGFKGGVENSLLDFTVGDKGSLRSSFFKDVQSARDFAFNGYKTKETYTGKKPGSYITNKATMFKKWTEGKLNSMEAHKFGEQNKEALKDMITGLNELYWKDGKAGSEISHQQVYSMLNAQAASMVGLIKSASSLALLPIGSPKELVKQYGKEWVLEHTIPAKEIRDLIYEYVVTPPGSRKAKLQEQLGFALKQYHTTLIPKTLDTMVNEIYQESVPPTTKFDGKFDIIRERYHAEAFGNGFNIGLRNFITKTEYKSGPAMNQKLAQLRAERLREAQMELFPEGYQKSFAAKGLSHSNKTITEAIKKVDKAFELGRLKNKKRRGMSTWDFDDTLARTKSGVRARIPSTDGLPKPSRKVIFLAGGAGSGKSNVVKKLGLEKQGFKVVNQDISLEWLKKNSGLPENMNDLTSAQRSTLGKLQHQARGIAKRKMMKYKGNAEGVVVDGTGGSRKAMEGLVKEFKDKGYDVSMLFVETSLNTALERNRARKERSLLDKIVEKNHEAVQGNKEGFRKMFGDRFMEVATDKLKMNDAMPKHLTDKMNDFVYSYEKRRLDAEQFATEGQKILEQGGKFDFSEFNVVTEGTKGPFFQKALERAKKFGTKDQFVLTARPPEAQRPIYEFLKSQGLHIPEKNITGLGNSTGEAKAMWMLKKFSEGYNDMYFADDAMQNVKAVKHVLDQLDIKSKVQQALAAKNLSKNVNNIMEYSLGIKPNKVFTRAEGKVRGKDIKRRRIFMTDSAADLELLIEPLYGKGKKGIENKKWFDKEFINPFERGIRDYNTARQSAKTDYMSLRKENKDVVKRLNKEVEGTNFTLDQAMRVYLWNKAGYKIPDLAKTTEAKLVDYIKNDSKLVNYAEAFAKITKLEKGLKEPSSEWWAQTIAGEVSNVGRGVSRQRYLKDWIDVKNEIFSPENLNKMESKLGTRWRENIEDMFDRMETGRTRSLTTDRGSAMMIDYLNGSVGTIMNFNTRSAALQTISTLNFLNMAENNPIAAARAMGNVKQFAKDFKYIMNSDMLKQRRDGLEINVSEAELASAAASSKNPIQGMIAKVLKLGYTPTKLADSFAISFGGATFYRNRIKMYEKQGMSTKEAEAKAWTDFQKLSERTQQSSRPDLLSRQQTSLVGRVILPFANTPMQMNRRGVKEILDLSKGRYKNKAEVAEKVGRISYYMGAQVALFAGLQSAIFAMLLNDDDVSDEKIEKTKVYTANTISDSFLRGMGIQGAVIAALKNGMLKYLEQDERRNPDYAEVAEALLNISPPIGSKFGGLDRAGDLRRWNRDEPFAFELGNGNLEASLLTIQSITNAPLHAWYQNASNVKHSLNTDYENWQRALMLGGWTPYNVGIEGDKKSSKKKTKTKKKTKKINIKY